MVWVIHVEIAGQRQPDRFLITAGDQEKPREVTVGRPPTKVDTRPDIVVPEKSVSKIHAVLHVSTTCDDGSAGNRLIITDRSRYGTTVNGQKMALGGSQQLVAGDVVQLAPRTHLIVEELPVEVAVHKQHPHLDEVREAAARAGARLAHVYDENTATHVLYDPEDVAWSALVQGALRGVPFAGLNWLYDIASAGLLTNSMPSPPPVSELLVMGQAAGRPPTRVRLPPPCGGAAWRGLLTGLTFGYSASWQDEGLAALLSELGGRVVERPQSQGAREGPAVVVVLEEGGGARSGSLGAEELLTALLTLGAAGVRQRIAAAAGVVASGSGRQAAPAAAPPQPEASQGPADSDMTQEAEEAEEAEEAAARGGEVVEQRPGPGPGPGPSSSTGLGTGPGLRSQGRAETSRLLPATVPSSSLAAGVGTGARAGGQPPLAAAGSAREAAVPGADGWLVAARHPEDANTQATTADGSEPPPESQAAHEDAPPTKRRRLTAAAGAAAQPGNGRPAAAPSAAAASAAPTAATTGAAPPVSLASRLAAAPPPASIHMSAKPLLLSPVPTKHEPQDDAPWMTQNPHGRGGGGGGGGGASRRSGAGLRGAAIVVNEVPTPPATAPQAMAAVLAPAGRGKGRAGKGGGGGGLDDTDLTAAKVEPPAPEVLDASAQVVLEADLFAPTPEQQLPPRCRSGSAEPLLLHTSADGGGGGAESGSDGGPGDVLPDFKQFRKQGGQLPAVRIARPLPVFLVDNFQRTEEAEAFLRLEEERATNKRRADEMFRKAEAGAKKPPRAPRRG
ncbi:hypothetical protein PLESTM_000759100 [Pleodorina starrii]|nr:hypothetical protein PLESTM_000759100 [Pleodorina starrii]